MSFLRDVLGADLPVLAAPMAGGPTTPALVAAADRVGSFGFLAGGYRTPSDLEAQIAQTRESTARFGVNLFAPNATEVSRDAYDAYRERLLPIAEHYGVELPELRVDDDHWRDKVDLLVASAPAVVSFTFGLPDRATADALHRAGAVLAQTVTSAEEAGLAVDAGLDALVIQGRGAGGHSGTFTPQRPIADAPLTDLVAEIAASTSLPMIAGGGIGSAEDVRDVLSAGADAVAVGTLLLRASEAGTSATHRKALVDFAGRPTILTQSFTGRPARGIHNELIEAHPYAPAGYPAIHYLTQPIRRAAAAAGEPENVHLWAGTGFPNAREESAGDILRGLASDLVGAA